MSIAVIAELREGEVRHATLPAITAARQLAEVTKTGYDLILMGTGAKAGAEKLKDYGAANVLWSEAAALASYTAEGYAAAVAALVAEKGYTVVLAPATTTGKDMQPRLAGLLGAGMVSDVVCFDQGPSYVRPMYAGNALAKVAVDTPVHVITIREAAYDVAAPTGGSANVAEFACAVDAGSLKARFVEYQLSKSARPELAEAKIIVSAGRGVKDAAGVQLIEQLADAFGAALGASRAVVDEGLVPNDLQVGQTGKIVAPDLYIACGISGAIQHVAGMKDAKVIVAINKDEEAPIFEVADYGLVGDLFQAVPKLIEKVKEAKA
ncbi:MAG: electron transfer flavoprotein subunit alpha/FixB family protein [Deltaproteobacteria bacterium]|nr:electron transfer flavoprotein subunit alpha/FixB family protein [Deltaproteobacteria bacterium]